MKTICTSKTHALAIHDCVGKIINTYRQEMNDHVLRKDKAPHIAVSCAQVDGILTRVSGAAFHADDHSIEWDSVIYLHQHDLVCGKCDIFFTNKVIEDARRLGIL